MTDNSSTPSTPELPLSPSQGTPSTKKRGQIIANLRNKKARKPFWTTIPIGMVKGRDKDGGPKYVRRKTRPTGVEIANGQPVGKNYNIVFVHDGQRTAKTYEVTFTSSLDPLKSFRSRVVASSLRGLMYDIVREIGNLRAVEITNNFSIHFLAISEKEGMTEEIVPIPYAEELPGAQKPSSDEPVKPIVVED